ncbi:uncharacterized protein N7511_000915 [Penicillium nucicola]|uniref:uncharacterized protein n=1 Tax=Penicillium nucicola TaxID=1850975 RepID=UPI002544E5D3|nr:uncharacterized protein N7511_000915 [Penicillium nucicola]KAJ5775904.1 hypothetical protein N7511_000915 [Penicillium nucicola]
MASIFGLRALRAGRQILSSPSTLIAARQSRAPTVRSYSTSDHLPKIADTSVWTAMIPRFLRTRPRKDPSKQKSKEWNPATFYIIIFTLIGSQAIRMITLKNSYAAYTRSTDAKIELLREVITRTKNGEKVDVEKLLGTGDEAKEREWDEVLREIEAEDSLWHQKATESKFEEPKTETVSQKPAQPAPTPDAEPEVPTTESARKNRFY